MSSIHCGLLVGGW